MSNSETQTDDSEAAIPVPEESVVPDEKELLLQRRLARIEEALGLSPLI